MKALSIAFKDLQIFVKDRGALLQAILLPLAFIVVFSGVLGAIGEEDEPKDSRIPLVVVDLDGSEMAQALLDGLEDAGGLAVEMTDQAEAESQLAEHDIERVLTIPADFTAGLDTGETVTLRLTSHPDASVEQTEAVRLVIEGVTQDMALETQILAALEQMGQMQAGAEGEQSSFTVARMQTQAQTQFERAQERPLVTVLETVPHQEDDDVLAEVGNVAVPGFAVLFVFITAQSAARSVYDEKKTGSFRRLLAAPMSKGTILAGKLLPTFITGLVQMAIILGFGIFGLELMGLEATPAGNDPLALVVIAVLISLCSSAFGILIAAIARTENQIGGLSGLLLWGMGIVGGSIIPVFVLDQFLGVVPKFVPHYWANRALDNLLIRGAAFGDVTTEMAALLGFTALFFVVGLWRFDFD